MKIFSSLIIGLCLFVVSFLWFGSQPVVESYINQYEWDNTYYVERGDTLWDLAENISSAEEDYRIVIAAIKKVNKIDSYLKVNQKIILPKN